MRKSKIVATIGPACGDRPMLEGLIDAGMDVARMGFAHGKVEDHIARIEILRDVARSRGKVVGIMADLPGPKVRATEISQEIFLTERSMVEICAGTEPTTERRIVVNYDRLLQDLLPGDVIGMGDGSVTLQITDVGDIAHGMVLHGGRLIGRPGFKLPTGRLSIEVPTEEDMALLVPCLEARVDMVAISFVRTAADVQRVRALVGNDGPLLVVKVETSSAIDNLSEIIRVADAVMVARGDLGIDCPLEDVPHLQKHIIKSSIMSARPVITATQMLESMIQAPIPTRAETSDVANAVLDGSDALMLSGETAVGHDPVEAVATMARIICRAEEMIDAGYWERMASPDHHNEPFTEAMAHAAWRAAVDAPADAILCCTRSGATSRAMASLRPSAPLIGLTPNEPILGQQSLTWGVIPLSLPHSSTTEDVVKNALSSATAAGHVKSGDAVVVLAGSPEAGVGHTDMLRLVRVP